MLRHLSGLLGFSHCSDGHLLSDIHTRASLVWVLIPCEVEKGGRVLLGTWCLVSSVRQ